MQCIQLDAHIFDIFSSQTKFTKATVTEVIEDMMDVEDDDEILDNRHAKLLYTICLQDGTIVKDVTAKVCF